MTRSSTARRLLALAAGAVLAVSIAGTGSVAAAPRQDAQLQSGRSAIGSPVPGHRSGHGGDGRPAQPWIAFVSDRDSLDQSSETNDDIYLLNAHDGRTVRIVADPAGSPFQVTDHFPVVSADGRTLLFESNRDTTTFPNPDGSLDRFAFYTCRLHLEKNTPRCTHPRRVAGTVPAAYYQYYALTPDARTLVYVDPLGDLYRAPLDSRREPVKLASVANQPDVSPDGKRIAYNSLGNLWVINIDGTGAVQLTDRLGEIVDGSAPPVYAGPDWSPDGRRLAFHSTRGGRPDFDVWVMDAKVVGPDNVPVDLTASVLGPDGQRPSHERFPTWSPDGRQIGFFWHRESPTAGRTAGFNEGEIYVMNVDGSGVRNLTANFDVTRSFDDPEQIGDISPDWGGSRRR